MVRVFNTRRALMAGAAALAVCFAASAGARAAEATSVLPAPALDPVPDASGLQTAVFAGGCFWAVQGVFEHVRGVTKAVSGYAGGTIPSPGYEQVSTGATGHAEVVRVTFDPSQVSYGRLLQIFFTVALDPTEVNKQGPDVGTQYRSELFVTNPLQDKVARAYLQQLETSHAFSAPIATRVEAAGHFYTAEDYHQDYLDAHPTEPYVAINDMPKIKKLQQLFPAAWQAKPVLAGGLASTE